MIFQKSYDVEVLDLPESACTKIQTFQIDNEVVKSVQDTESLDLSKSYNLLITPLKSPDWLAVVFGDCGDRKRDTWLTCPDPESILIATRNECFYGRVDDPLSFQSMPIRPFYKIIPCLEEEIMLISVMMN